VVLVRCRHLQDLLEIKVLIFFIYFRYLSTVKSPIHRAGAFKMPRAVNHDIPVFSQFDPNDDDYAYVSYLII